MRPSEAVDPRVGGGDNLELQREAAHVVELQARFKNGVFWVPGNDHGYC